eukprot:gene3476-13537_t
MSSAFHHRSQARILENPVGSRRLNPRMEARAQVRPELIAASGDLDMRWAEVSDAAALAQLDAHCKAAGSAGWSAETFACTLGNPISRVVICSEPPSLGSETDDVDYTQVAGELQIENLAVHPSSQGRGVGYSLMKTLLTASGVLPGGAAWQGGRWVVGVGYSLMKALLTASGVLPGGAAWQGGRWVVGVGYSLMKALLTASGVLPGGAAWQGGRWFGVGLGLCLGLGLGLGQRVRADNEPAMALYTKLGFKSVGKRRGYYADGSDCIIMSLTNA